jgi:hypothetical protein
MTELPLGEKWVAKYKDVDGKASLGMCNHHNALSPLVSAILKSGGKDIVITDETARPRIIDGVMEIMNEENSALAHLD